MTLNDRDLQVQIIRFLEFNGFTQPSRIISISDPQIDDVVGRLSLYLGLNESARLQVEAIVRRQISAWLEELKSAMVAPGARVKDHDWVPESVTRPSGMFSTFLHNLTKESWSDGDIARLRWSVLSTLGAIGDPKAPGRTRGLVVGRVQSGKTTHYIALILAALQAGYRRILVLGGHNNSLRAQCQRRLFNAFRNLSTEGVAFQFPDFVTTDQEDGDLTSRNAYRRNPDERAQIFVCKKNATPLGEFLKNLGESAVPLLIIDDEADWGTQNVSPDPEQDQTPINELISGIIRTQAKEPAHRAYVAYTATPYANLLVSEDDAGAIVPEFVKVLTPGQGYLGNDAIVGEGQSGMLPIFCDRKREDPSRAGLRNGLDEQDLVDDLQKGIRYFVLAAAGYRAIAMEAEGRPNSRAKMLINDSTLKEHHAEILSHVQRLLKEITTSLLMESPDEVDKLREIWESVYRDNWLKFQKRIGGISSSAPTWEGLMPHLLDVANALMPGYGMHDQQVRIINSDNEAWTAASEVDRYKEMIYIGGLVFSRGVTVADLSTVIFAASAVQRDTLMQYARWLGYRGNFAPLLRVLLPKVDKEAYAQVARLDRKLWSFLQHACDQRLNPAEAQIVVPQEHEGLRPTSSAKMKLAVLTLEARMVEPVTWEPSEIGTDEKALWNDSALELIEESSELAVEDSRVKFFKPASREMLSYLTALAKAPGAGGNRMRQLLEALEYTGEMNWIIAVPIANVPEASPEQVAMGRSIGAFPRVANRTLDPQSPALKRKGGGFSGFADRRLDFYLRTTNAASVSMAIKAISEGDLGAEQGLWTDERKLWHAPSTLSSLTIDDAKDSLVSMLREDLRRKARVQVWDNWLRRPGEAFCVIQAFNLAVQNGTAVGPILIPSLVTPRAESSTFGMVPRERGQMLRTL